MRLRPCYRGKSRYYTCGRAYRGIRFPRCQTAFGHPCHALQRVRRNNIDGHARCHGGQLLRQDFVHEGRRNKSCFKPGTGKQADLFRGYFEENRMDGGRKLDVFEVVNPQCQAVFYRLSFICGYHDRAFGDDRGIQLYHHYRRISRFSSDFSAIVDSGHSNRFSRIYRYFHVKAAGKRVCKLFIIGYGKKESNPAVPMRSPVDWFFLLYSRNNNGLFHIWILVFP